MGDGASSYKTIEGRAIAEIVEKKSRFIGHIAHVETEEEALAFLNEIRTEHRMARHNVYAYVLRENGRVRYSDDGEPQKTAGMPTHGWRSKLPMTSGKRGKPACRRLRL